MTLLRQQERAVIHQRLANPGRMASALSKDRERLRVAVEALQCAAAMTNASAMSG